MEETENTRKRKRQYSKELLEPPKGPGLCRSQKQCVTEKLKLLNSPTSCGSMFFMSLSCRGTFFA